MKTIGAFLQKRKEHKKITLLDKDIFYIFRRIIKEEYGNCGEAQFIPNFYKNKILFVKAENSAWGSELFSNRTSLIRKINKELGEDAIIEIKLK